MRARHLAIAIALLCFLAWPATAMAKNGNSEASAKIDTSVQTVEDATGDNVAVPVIVYAPGNLGDVQNVLPMGVDTTQMPIINGVAAYLTPDEIQTMASQSFVTSIVADNPVFGFDYTSSMDITNLSIGLGKVDPPANGGPDGAGVTVAILDTGVSTNTDLAASRIVGWKDLVNNRPTPYDDAGHGTFVAGLIAGDGTASLPLDSGGYATMQFRGVAPDANIVGIKVLDDEGSGLASTVISGIDWAIHHKNEYGIRVLNISIGAEPVGPVSMDPIAQAVEAAWRSGIVVVCAAGNEGDSGMGGVLSPGNDPYVLTVGAADTQQTADTSDDTVAYYSSWGPTLFDETAKPDVVAPGNRVVSLRVPGSYIDTNFPANLIPVSSYAPTAPAGTVTNYLMLSGTSASTPVVSGAVALMLQKDPSLTPGDVKLRLMQTADPLAGASPYQEGAGEIDVSKALADTATTSGYDLSADLGNGLTILNPGDYSQWENTYWNKYGWVGYHSNKFAWNKFRWTKFRWTDVAWTKFRWTKFRWTDYQALKFRWTKFRWTVLVNGQ